MKVLLVNGSAHKKSTTYYALAEVQKALNEQGIETEFYNIPSTGIVGCIGCGACFRAKQNKCMAFDDEVNKFSKLAESFDGFVFGTPIHYASPSGNLISLLDRAFYSNSTAFRYKPAASVVCCRRGGASSGFDVLNKYFTINNMPVVSSQYWNMVYGAKDDEALSDTEGLQTMRTLGYNMAWILKCIEEGRKKGITPFAEGAKERTNFIR